MNIFISYSREDHEWAKKIFDWLKSTSDYNPWIDSENLLPGTDWELEILTSIRSAKAILLLISKNSVSKVGYIQKEIKEVIARFDYFPPNEIFIIPVRLDNTVPKYPTLEKLHWVDLYLDTKRGFEKILKALEIIKPKLILNDTIPQMFYNIYENVPNEIIHQIYNGGEIEIEGLDELSLGPVFKILKGNKASVLSMLVNHKLIKIDRIKYANARPHNAEQTFFYAALSQKRISIVCLNGVSGTGKSFLTANYLLHIVNKKKIFILGNSKRQQKIHSYLIDNINPTLLEQLGNSKKINLLNELSDLAHYDIGDSIVVCNFDDGTQYRDIKEMLLLMQDDTKFILISQQEPKNTPIWLITLYEKLKNENFFTYIALNKIHRSAISMLLNEIL